MTIPELPELVGGNEAERKRASRNRMTALKRHWSMEEQWDEAHSPIEFHYRIMASADRLLNEKRTEKWL